MKSAKTKNHDSHYSKQTIEPINVIEQVARNIDKTELSPEAKNSILQATKYLLRIGCKDEPLKELAKARNYINRASTGKWV